MEKKQPLMSKFKPQKALFTDFTNNASIDKENYPQSSYYQTPMPQYNDGLTRTNFSLEGLYPQKPPGKRLMEAAPIHESRPFKKTKTEEVAEADDNTPKELPAPDSFPPLEDDGSKPPHSYAQLIGMSILRAHNRRLTLAQIYKWISDTYSFYCATDAGWQNSIRHNLSLNKAFVKQERPKDDPGKGNYWAIVPGMEHQFIKDKTTRKPANSNENVPVLSTNLMPLGRPESQQFKTLIPALPELPPPPMSSQQTLSMPEPPSQAVAHVSSDATIPASDAFVSDQENEVEDRLPSSPLIRSSPPPMMNSSPPVSRNGPKRHDTPPPVPRFPASSTSRSRKRKYSTMDDSGYYSSLDSSAMRPNRLLTSEADRPRIKRGRAEEEIARLRGSSYDSPTKSRVTFAPPSSSPLRIGLKVDSSQMLPPLTPIVKLKPPVRAPPSASPNTNLRLHRDKMREMVGSPLRGMTVLDTENVAPWSPAFQLDDHSYMFHDFNTDFDIFDPTAGLLSIPGNGSPEKRSAKRPRLDRSKSTSVLGDISSSSFLNKNITSTPLLKFTPKISTPRINTPKVNTPKNLSPLKGFGLESPSELLGITSPSKYNGTPFAYDIFDYTDDFFNPDLIDELAEETTGGWDIMAGFQKIGSGNATSQSKKNTPVGKSPKPATRSAMHNRSFTSRF
jgi:forkhead transcription factor HCM1